MTDTLWCELAVVDGVVHESVTIEIDHGRFAAIEIGRLRPADAALRRGLTLPGLANAHSHAFHRALRGRVQVGRGSFWTWRDLMYRAAGRLDPDSYFALARATFAEMALAGITTVGEFHYVHHGPEGGHYDDPNAMGRALIAAAAEAGVRITLLDTVYLCGGLEAAGHVPVADVQRRFTDGTVDAWSERVAELEPSDGWKLGAAIHSVRAVDPPSIAAVATWAAERRAPLHAHVSEQSVENDRCRAAFGCSPTGLLADAGALTGRFTAIHATHASASDIRALADAGSMVCVCPTTERDLGDGIGPTAELSEAGVSMALGTDSHAVIDVLEEARAVELDERLASGLRGVHPVDRLVTAATSNGHHSIGWDDAGSISVGNRADLVGIALDSVRTAGSNPADALEMALFAATAADVTDVMIDGRAVVTDGLHRSLDVPRELHRSITDLMED